MDPSIMKILEDDEPDESQYSGADVDAFTAELNRDIGGDMPASQTSDSNNGSLVHGNNATSHQLLEHWQTSGQEENATGQSQQETSQHIMVLQEHQSSETETTNKTSGLENQTQQISCSREQDQCLLQPKASSNTQNAIQRSDESKGQDSKENKVQTSEQSSVQHSEQDNRLPPSEIPQNKVSRGPPVTNQVPPVGEQANNPMKRNKPTSNISFAMLIPFLRPHLDKDRNMQLETIFAKLRRNEVNKEDFLRLVRNIVGDPMLRMAAQKVQARQQAQDQAAGNAQTGPLPYQHQSQTSSQQLTAPSSSARQFSEAQKYTSQGPTSTVKILADANPTPENNSQKSRETGVQKETQGIRGNQASVKTERENSMISSIPVNKQQLQQQQHLHLPPTSFPMYSGTMVGNYNPQTFSTSSMTSGPMSLRPQTPDQLRQVPHHQGTLPGQSGASQPMSLMTVSNYELQNNMSENKRIHGGSVSHLANTSSIQQNSTTWPPSSNKEQKNSGLPPIPCLKQEPIDLTGDHQHRPPQLPVAQSSSFGAVQIDQNTASGVSNPISGPSTGQMYSMMQMRSQVPSMPMPAGSGANARTPPKKPTVGQKKPLETGGTPPPASKKQKVSGALLDQSIEQLNDVTAVSGVNLREEEEQLLAAPKEESRASEATRKVVQEEEERLILQKVPLQRMIMEIMTRHGIKNASSDVERCLSLSVEERMRGLISNLIRLSKQRVDLEKPRHRYIVTSDVRRQIMVMNQKAKEVWDKKRAEEAEMQRKLNEAEANTGADVDKDESRAKAIKANKEEDDKMRTTAANVAARAAVGGDDMLQKWQLMAEQARQKREGLDGASSSASQSAGELNHRPSSIAGKSLGRDNQEAGNRASGAATSGSLRKMSKSYPSLRPARSISIKDVITVLEREPQMSKSPLLYKLYEKMQAGGATE